MLNFKTPICESCFAKKMFQSSSKSRTNESASLASQPTAKQSKQAKHIKQAKQIKQAKLIK